MSDQMIPAIVLAAGASSRCPGGKLLQSYRGRPLLEWTLEALQESRVGPIVLVTGHASDQIQSLAGPRVHSVHNPNWSEGISSSIRVGIENLPESCPGVLLALGDTPFFTPETLHRIIGPGAEQEIRVPIYRGQMGHPKYFPSWLFPELKQLAGDRGAKALINNHQKRCRRIEVDDPGTLRDFDRPSDFLDAPRS